MEDHLDPLYCLYYLPNHGMIGFHYLERDNEDIVREDTRNFKDEILANFTCLTSEDLEVLITKISHALSNGVDPSNNATSPSNWDYESAFFSQELS